MGAGALFYLKKVWVRSRQTKLASQRWPAEAAQRAGIVREPSLAMGAYAGQP